MSFTNSNEANEFYKRLIKNTIYNESIEEKEIFNVNTSDILPYNKILNVGKYFLK